MRPKSAKFVTSAVKPSQYPPEQYPEIAFAGRSNVGKSSLINSLVAVDGLAKTSNTPGRTRLVNWFEVETAKGKRLSFVDLPGYGYAKVPRAMRDSWRPMVESYLTERTTLRGVILLIDCRREAQREEVELCEWLHDAGIEPVLVVTKIDKLPKSKRKLAALNVKKQLGLRRPPIVTSAESGEGLTDVWRSILAACGK
jgi:GTP-binding protein